MNTAYTMIVSAGALVLIGCDSGVNIFNIQDDIELGAQLRDEIVANPADYPPLDEAAHPEAYNIMYAMRDEILASGQVRYAEDFAWELRIIDDPETLNAFAAPGGYIWFYTGLIEFLDFEDEVAGVLGHEIAHADQRHSTQQLTATYGLSTLASLILGEDPGTLTQIAIGLAGLSFSRTDESEADRFSVTYLCETRYASDGAAGFFEKLESSVEIPEFLSTHPNSATRVEDIKAEAAFQACGTERFDADGAQLQVLIDSLP
ncbi:MAG: M48 family metalloprotease [Myxococcota bacterium]